MVRKNCWQAVAFLQGAKENTTEIKRQFNEIGNMWIFFDTALTGSQTDRPKALDNLAVASELILKGYDDLTGLYARLA